MEPPTPDWNPQNPLKAGSRDTERAALQRWKKSLQHLGVCYGIMAVFLALICVSLAVHAVEYIQPFSLYNPGEISPETLQFHWSPLLIAAIAAGSLIAGGFFICQFRALAAGLRVVAPASRLWLFWGDTLSRGVAKSRAAIESRHNPLSGGGQLLEAITIGWLSLASYLLCSITIPATVALIFGRLEAIMGVVADYHAGTVSNTYSELFIRSQVYLSLGILAPVAVFWLAATITRVLAVKKLNAWASTLTARNGSPATQLYHATQIQRTAMVFSVVPVACLAAPIVYLYGLFQMVGGLDALIDPLDQISEE